MGCVSVMSIAVLILALLVYLTPELLFMKSKSCLSYATNENEDPYGRNTFNLKDGRYLEWSQVGNKNASRVYFGFHGLPQTSMAAMFLKEIAEESNVRVIVTARPGFGLSSYKHRTTMAEFIDDVLELADELGIQRFGVVGMSGGGPYAYASAALIPRERLVETLVVCGVGPLDFVENPTEGMNPPNALMFSLPMKYHSLLGYLMISNLVDENAGIPDAILEDLLPKDREFYQQKSDDWIKLSMIDMKQALRCGIAGIYSENSLIYQYNLWGCTLDQITGPITIVHGGKDGNVPPSHAKAMYAAIPEGNKKLKIVPEDGHVSIVHSDEVLQFFKEDTNWK